MNSLAYTIELQSDALPASGIIFSAIIDTDIVVDDQGLPYVPAKRIKGLLLESLTEVGEMSGTLPQLDRLFGTVGKPNSDSLFVSEGRMQNYSSFSDWIKWAKEEHPEEFQPESIIEAFTSIRRQTRLEKGVAKEHSLRTVRVLNKGHVFEGTVSKAGGFDQIERAQLALAFSNLRYFGLNRNRGFGRIHCALLDEMGEGFDLVAALALCREVLA